MQKILSRVRRCVEDYNMISAGDRIAAGVSGGKDSLGLLAVMAKLSEFYPRSFEIVPITLDMGYGADLSAVTALCREYGLEHVIKQTNIKNVVFDIRNEKNPCALCAKLRRGSLNEEARARGCNKVALGHHLDDAVETFMMSLIFEGRLSCFQPVTWLDRTELTVIRPMLYVYERQLISLARRLPLPVIDSGCPIDGGTKRQEMKELIAAMSKTYPGYKERLFTAMRDGLPGFVTAKPKAGKPPAYAGNDLDAD